MNPAETPVTEAATREKVSFSFGQNWQEFIDANFSEERLEIARKHLVGFLDVPDLQGRYFLDIGCGSGIHSLAAFKAGAGRIVSFDLDPLSVKTTRRLREMVGSPNHWEVHEGSILDRSFVSRFEPAEIVYSWGVLHHTGRMWEAVENAASRIAPGGLFYIALYNTHPLSDYWLKKKKQYNRASTFGKRLMETKTILMTSAYALLRMRNPIRQMVEYKKSRGMSYLTDIRDWLGGYPYEHASPAEGVRFGVRKLGLQLVAIDVGQGSSAVTEYLFRKP